MKITLICLPFAGGSKHSLQYLKKELPENISCFFSEYAGHGMRGREPFMESLDDIAADMYAQVEHLLDAPYAIYGHSMGALLTYLLAIKIRENGRPAPLHLFVSGADAPSAPLRREPRHTLSRDAFISAVQELGGLPSEFLEDREMIEYFESILRADFRVVETFVYTKAAPLDIPLTVMVGDEEDFEEEDIKEWQSETLQPVRFVTFPGNHFFIYEHKKDTIDLIVSGLRTPLVSK